MEKTREFTKEETQTIVREKCKEWLDGQSVWRRT